MLITFRLRASASRTDPRSLFLHNRLNLSSLFLPLTPFSDPQEIRVPVHRLLQLPELGFPAHRAPQLLIIIEPALQLRGKLPGIHRGRIFFMEAVLVDVRADLVEDLLSLDSRKVRRQSFSSDRGAIPALTRQSASFAFSRSSFAWRVFSKWRFAVDLLPVWPNTPKRMTSI